MTPLEQLIHQQVQASTLTSLSRSAEKVADDLTQEILKDKAFRAWMRTFVQKAFEQTMTELQTPTKPARKRKGR